MIAHATGWHGTGLQRKRLRPLSCAVCRVRPLSAVSRFRLFLHPTRQWRHQRARQCSARATATATARVAPCNINTQLSIDN